MSKFEQYLTEVVRPSASQLAKKVNSWLEDFEQDTASIAAGQKLADQCANWIMENGSGNGAEKKLVAKAMKFSTKKASDNDLSACEDLLSDLVDRMSRYS